MPRWPSKPFGVLLCGDNQGATLDSDAREALSCRFVSSVRWVKLSLTHSSFIDGIRLLPQ